MSGQCNTDVFKEVVTIFLALILVLTIVAYPILQPGTDLPEYVLTFGMMGAQFLFGAVAGTFAVKNYVRVTEATLRATKVIEKSVPE